MRLIFTILLIGLFRAEGQMIINASALYRPQVSVAAFLLDDYPNAAAAYSLRKLDKDYTGSAIRVRKDTTGQPEQDIGFTASGDLDTAALKSFINARSAFVVTWYDQSGSNRNATQTTAVNQPRIANTGIIERQNGKPTIWHTNTFLNFAYPITSKSQAYCIWMSNNTNFNVIPYGSTNAAGEYYGVMENSNSSPDQSYGTPKYYKNLDAQLTSTRATLRTAYIINNIVLSYVLDIELNNINKTIRTTYIGVTQNQYVFEYILYSNTTNNRIGISNNINTYYTIW